MRVCIASAPHEDSFGYSMPPPGLLRLGGALRSAGIEVALEDLAYQLGARGIERGDGMCASAARRIAAAGPWDVVGLSCMGATLPAALVIAAELRALAPRTRIALGGPGAGGIELELMQRFPALDALVRGEGERTLLEWLARIESGRDGSGCAGLVWRRADGSIALEAARAPIAELGELPRAAWELLPPIADYKRLTGEADGLVAIDSGRGCAYDCSFCSIGRFWGRRSRALPVARLVEEIAELARLPGAKRAYLCHDLFGADEAHALALCAELERRALGIPWEVRARADHLSDALIEAMGRAGAYRVLIGLESGDPALRNAHDKHMRPELDARALVAKLAAAGITPILSLMLGLPGESERELAATLELALDCAQIAGVNLSFHLPNPQPGCRLGEEWAARSRPLEGIAPDMALGAGNSAPERALIDAHPDLFSTWSLIEGPGGAAGLRALAALRATLPELWMRYPRSYALLARRAQRSALELFRDWQATGRSFEAFALAARDARVDACLAWEQALVRAARGAPAQLLRVPLDLGALRRALAAGGPLPEPSAAPRAYAIAPRAGAIAPGARGARTLALSAALADALERARAGAASECDPRALARLDEHQLLPQRDALIPS